MKTKSIYLVISLIGLVSWSCSNQDDLSQKSLQTTLQDNIATLNTAVAAITSSDSYKILNISDTQSSANKVSSASNFVIDSTMNSIMLADIAGVYDYKANYYKKEAQMTLRFFSKTADSSIMMVRLPEEKVKNSNLLMFFRPSDTLLVNNYNISLSQYEYTFNRFLGWNYKMASNINIKDVNAGDLQIQSSNSNEKGYKYASSFAFTDGYNASCTYATGDTAIATYNLTNDSKILYQEKYTSIKSVTDKRYREKEYALTIGDIQIIRNPIKGSNSLDSAKIYVSGVLQPNAKVEIIDVIATDETDNSIVKQKRDIQITFDNGTKTTIKTLLGESAVSIHDLFATLRQASFSTAIIDKIAWDIYKNK